MKILLLFCMMLSISISTIGQTNALIRPKYNAKDGAILGHNIGSYNNRPLYINNSSAFILTGDQPIARLVKDQYLFGTFMVAIERKGKRKWLQQCDQINSIYRAGRMAWEITDKAFPGLKANLEILPMESTTGMAIRVNVKGVQRGDILIWTFGGAQWRENQNLSWKLDIMGQPELLTWGFVPGECKNNMVETKGRNYFVSLIDSISHNKIFTVFGICSSTTKANISDAYAWKNPTTFKNVQSQQLPLLTGTVLLEEGKPVYWEFEALKQDVKSDL